MQLKNCYKNTQALIFQQDKSINNMRHLNADFF